LGNLGEYQVKSILLGRAVQKALRADVWNHPTVEELGRMFGQFEGLIGFPFFAHYQVTIDYKAKTMTLVPCIYTPDDTAQKMTNKLTQPSTAKVYLPSESIGIQVSKAPKDESAGVIVSTVMPGSPADEAGFKVGDRLLTLDGRWTDSVEDCYAALTAVDSGRDVPAVLLHDGKQTTVQVKVKQGI
jgi:predicted metalloprotease with PDZ domain